MGKYPNIKHPEENKSRLGGYGRAYFEISQKEYSKYLEDYDSYEHESDPGDKSKFEDEAFEAAVKTIIFASLCVEASINDYAAWQLGDNYFESHLSNLDVASKWVVIPNLICGVSFDKSGPGFSALKSLMRFRNLLIHNKSENLSLSHPSLDELLTKRTDEFTENTHNAYRALLFLSFEFDMLVGPKYNPIGTLDKEINWTLSIPENLLDIFSKCKNIVTRNAS